MDSSERDECVVWQEFINGNDESLIYIYRKYADVLFKYGRQFVNRNELVRDSIQELFCELIDKRKGLSEARSVKGYLFASLKRKIVRSIKKDDKLQFEEEGFNIKSVDQLTTFNQPYEEKDLSLIREKVNELPVAQREVLLLYFYEGLGYEEIADIMDIKVRSARSLTYRALDSLQKFLQPHKNVLLTFILCLGLLS